MRVCLVPLRIEVGNPAENFHRFEQRLAEVARHRPDLICLPECAFTGYLCTEQDFEEFAEPIPGPTTHAVSLLAKIHRSYICFGMLERASEGVYSSAALMDKEGELILVHRKIHEQLPFVKGREVKAVDTELGRLSVLLCGDLFDDEAKAMLDDRLDVLIIPMARCFDGKSPDLERWLKEERQAYAEQIKKVGVTGLLVNSLENSGDPEAAFGGAMIVNANGEILAESRHGTDDLLIYDIDR
jgi:predicted amidohydrolase